MVHRPPDSRLLTNLLQQEKEYTKHLSQVLDASNVSLASFAAYAAASPPPVSQVIMTVAGSLAAADEALRKYAHGVEEWREMMRQLKDTEDEVANIMRDREILVTRLIKASKSQKPGSNFRDSLLLSHHKQSSSSSLSLSVGTQQDSPSPPPSRPLSSAFSTTSTGNSKLAAAQSELQACEMHLASKERELTLKRCSVVRDGLGARMKALANCGWAWEELGKEALRTLEELNVDNIDQQIPPPRIHEPRNSSSDVQLSINNLHTHNSGILNESSSPSFGLLPPLALDGLNDNSARPSSDFSSIGPSQSASQVNAGSHELHMPVPISLMNSGLFGDPPSAPKTEVVESVVVESTSEATDEENEENTTESNDESEHEQKPDEDSRPTTISNQGEKEDDSNEALLPPRRPHSAFSGGTGGTTSSMHYSPILVATPTAALKLESAQAIAMRLPPRDSPRLGERTPRDSPRPSGSSTQNTTGEPPNPATTTTVVRIPPAHAFKENGYAYDIPTAESSPRAGPSTLNANANVPGRPSSRASSNRSSSDRHGPAASSSGLGRLGLGTWHRPQIERRITEEEMRRSFNLDENVRSRLEGQAQAQAQAPPEASSDEVEDEEELVRREKKLVKEGKLAVVENPRFMSEARRKELEKEKEREEEERRRVKEKEKEKEREKDKDKEKEEKKKRFTLFHTNSHSSQQQQQHARSASVSFAGTGTTETPPSPSPSKSGFFGSLKGLFSNRPLASPTRKKEDHQANATTTTTTTTKTVDTPRAIDISDSDSELEAGASRGGAMHNLFSGGSKKGKGKGGSSSSGKWETRTDKNIQKLAKRESFDEDTITKRRGKPSLYAGGGVAAGVVAGVGLNTGGMGSVNGSAVRVGAGPASVGAGRGRTVSDVGVSSAAGNARPPARRLTKKGKEREGEHAGGGIPTSVSAPAPAALVSVRAPPPVSTSALSSQVPSSSRLQQPQQPQAQTQARLKHRRSASVDVDAQRRNSLHSNKTATTDDEGDTNEDGGNGTSSGGEGMIVDLGRRRRRRAASEAGAGVRKESAEEIRQGVVRRQRDEEEERQRGRTAVPVAAVQAPAAAAGAEGVAKKKSLTKKKQVEQAAEAPPVTGTSTPMQTPSRQPSVKSSSATKATPPPATTTSYGATVLPAGGDHPSGTLVSQPGWKNQAQGTGGGLSRNNSIGSTASAPATPGSQAAGGRGKAKKRTVLGQGVSGAPTGVGRRASLNAGSTTSTSGTTSGSVVQPTPAIPSLMSIVEDVAKLNKEGWRKDLEKDRDRMPPPPKAATSTTTTTVAKPKGLSSPVFEVPKAPPPVSREMLEGLGSTSVSSANQSRTSLATITPATSSPPPAPVTTKKKAGSASPPQSKSGSSSTGMFEIKAPGSVFNNQFNNLQRPTIARASSSATKAAVTNANTAFNTNPNNLTVGGSGNAVGSGTGSLSRRPDKSPLRSALKDTSRSPSPAMHQQLHQDSSASAVPPPVNGSLPWGSDGTLSTQSSRRPSDKADDVKGKGKVKATSAPAPPPVARRYSHESTGTSGDESYETGNEFYTEDEDQPPPPPPISSKMDVQAVPKVALNGHALAGGEGYEYDAQKAASQSALSQSSVSTVTATRPSAPPSAVSSGGGSSQGQGQGQTPRRRKSVRVSLKPTFSPSPPAIEYDCEEGQNVYAPWSRQADAERADRGRQREKQQSRVNTTQVNGHQEPLPALIPLRAPGLEPKTVADVVDAHESERDMWQDSGSDEDEEYARAKKLLTRAAKKERSVSRLAMVANRA